MVSLVPVDHDPFADGAPAAPPVSSFGGPDGEGAPAGSLRGGPVLVPVDHDPFADTPAPSDDDARPLTIHGGRQAPAPVDDAPTPATPIAGSSPVLAAGFSPARGGPSTASAQPPASADTSAPARGMSYDAAATPDTPHPGGVLSNSADDGYVSGTLKGAATGAIKGVGDAVGFVGGLSHLADYLIARGESAVTGQPVDEVQAAHAAKRKAFEAEEGKSTLGRLVVRSDPTKVLPAPDDVSGPILAKTGEYVPQTEAGKVAQAGVEAAVGAFGPGGGAISPGTAGRTVVSTLARQAPTMAAAGGLGQAVTDTTGDPLLGLGAGLVGVPLAEAGLSHGLKALAPVVGGVGALNRAPVIGPAIARARGNEVAGKILGQSDDPAAVQAAVAQPAPVSAVPGSSQTFAGQIGNDQGLFEAEKALRNTKAEKVEDGSAPTYFNGVDRAQSEAQIAALKGIQPEGDVFRPGQTIAQRMDAIDTAAQDAIDRLTAAHQDAVASRAGASQAFADQARGDLAARQADRTQAGVDFAGQQRADLADRTIARGQASGEAKDQADAARQASHDALVQSFADAHARQFGTAQDAAAPLAGGQVDAADLGASLRGAIEQVRAGAKDLHRNLYNAVDPEGTLALVARPVQDRATGIIDQVRADGSAFSPTEAPLFARAAALPDVAPYRVIHALDKDIGAAMSTERRTAGESPAWARLTQLKGAVKDAMTGAADHQAAWEQSQVDIGAMAHENTIAARLQQDFDANRSAQPLEARAAVGADYGASTTARAPFDPGQDGAQVPHRGYAGPSSGGASLSAPGGRDAASREVGTGPRPDAPAFSPDGTPRAPQRPDTPRPQDLQAFIRARGGIRDTGGDLASMGLTDLIAKGKVGLSLDRMRRLAAEAGYLGADTARAMAETHPNDLLDAVSSDHPVHSVRDEDAAAAWADYDAAKERHDAARGEFGTRSRFGVVPERAPLDAYSREDIEGPGGPQVPEPTRSGLAPTFDTAAANRLKAANAAYAQYARTYKNPVVGPGLRTTGYAGQYARSDAAFIKAAIKPGADGYANAKAYLEAAKNDPDALAAMQDAALNPLRRAVTGNGTLPPGALARWRSPEGFGPALRALDEIMPGLSSRFRNAADATQALADLGAEHKAALATAQKEAARQAVIDNLQRRESLKQESAADKASVNALLAERAANDRAAGLADRADVASSVADRRASDRAANVQSKADRDAAVSTVRDIRARAKATPAADFGKAAGTAIASTEVENAVGSFLKTGTDGAARMRGLVSSVEQDPGALAGLRKAGVDWLVRNHLNADGTLSGAKFISFLLKNRDTLRELYPHAEVSMMGAIARDAENNARWRTTTAVKGGSDSVKNLLASLDSVKGSHAGHVTLGMVAVEAISQGLEHAGVTGAAYAGAAAASAYLVNTLRQAGIKRTADLYREAMANPELARALISKMPTSSDASALHTVARVLKRNLIIGPMVTGQSQPAKGPAAPPQTAPRGGALSAFLGG
jgi:hypothetical protein